MDFVCTFDEDFWGTDVNENNCFGRSHPIRCGGFHAGWGEIMQGVTMLARLLLKICKSHGGGVRY